MKKLIRGIIEFREKVSLEYKETFSKLALSQSPDALFVTCSDSRVAPNLFVSTDPGDLVVLRNVGNLIPPCSHNHDHAVGCESAPAAIEFAVLNLNVSSIIICGHSDCGAMRSLIQNCDNVHSPNLRSWLQIGAPALEKLKKLKVDKDNAHNILSQLNVLEQINHMMSYAIVKERVDAGTLKIYGWWFDIGHAEVFAYNEVVKKFVPLNREEGDRIIQLSNGPLA